jgi:hypothetical protein
MAADRGGSVPGVDGGSATGLLDGLAGAPARPVVAPGPAASAVLRPLPADAVRLTGDGLLAGRIAANAQHSLAAGLDRLTAAGTLDNLRLAAAVIAGTAGTAGSDAADASASANGAAAVNGSGPANAVAAANDGYHGKLPFLDSDVYKWLEAVSWHLQSGGSAEWSERADAVIALVAAAQQPDGYVNSFVTVRRGGERWADLPSGHELYCAGHLIQAGVAHRRATGADSLFGIARRFADLLVAEFREGGRRVGYCGHPEVETALVELYRETGTRAYLELARRFVDLRGSGLLGDRPFGRRYFQDQTPVRQTRAMHGHAVRALYLAAGVADLYLETGDAELLEVLRDQWSDLLRGKTYVTGGVGARHRDEAFGDAFELPADRAYTETCAAIALLQWAWRMQLATGESQYADMFERVLYNGFLAGVSLDGLRYFYVNPLHVRPDSTLGPHGRQEWFSCACCPPNVMRTLASLSHYFATADTDGLQIHQYASGSIRANGGAFGVDVQTGYPFDGAIRLTVPEQCAGRWTLSLRIPAWARGAATLLVDGQAVELAEAQDVARLSRQWRGGETIELSLPLRPRLTVADPRVDDARGCVAVERGPLVYCAEQVDQKAELTDLTLTGTARDGGKLELGGLSLPTVQVDAGVSAGRESGAAWPYRTFEPGGADGAAEERTILTAIPYFAWANREYGGMRVWLAHDRAGRA